MSGTWHSRGVTHRDHALKAATNNIERNAAAADFLHEARRRRDASYEFYMDLKCPALIGIRFLSSDSAGIVGSQHMKGVVNRFKAEAQSDADAVPYAADGLMQPILKPTRESYLPGELL